MAKLILILILASIASSNAFSETKLVTISPDKYSFSIPMITVKIMAPKTVTKK
jgi:hypothetical protein